MAAIYSNGGNRWNILSFNFTKRDALSSLYIRYLWFTLTVTNSVAVFLDTQAFKMASCVSLLFLNITESCFSRFLLRI
jgi:hypothetical protein